MSRNAVVLLSGGLDSATVLAIARERGFGCHCLSFDYGQRHRSELKAAGNLARASGASHQVIRVELPWAASALTVMDLAVPKGRASEEIAHGIPITYVPARNLIFLSYAISLAESIGSLDVFAGMNVLDYSGYPDCRPDFLDAFERTARLGTKIGAEGGHISIHRPLIRMTKSEIVREGTRLGVDYGMTLSCYDPVDDRPCGACDSCQLRARGFADAGLVDPAAGLA